jgi:hypothetical protein
VYWSWNGGPREGRGTEAIEKGGQISGGGGAGGGWDSIFENDQSSKVLDINTAVKLFEYSTAITGAEWPDLKAVTSPCPTLKVIGAVTKGMVQREELKRMREMGRPGLAEGKINMSRRKKIAAATDKVVSTSLKHTVGRLARFASRRVLGEIPEAAKSGSFDTVVVPTESLPSKQIGMTESDAVDLMKEVSQQLDSTSSSGPIMDQEDEALFQEIYNDKVVVPVKEKTTA